ncbi:MAG: alpha,3-galactosidase, partial [Verrucomicrobiota bacterium]
MPPVHAPAPDQTALDLHALVRAALRAGLRSVTLPPGEHRVSGRLLPERQLWISNNDSGWKPVLIDLEGAENFTVEGNGARLLVEGVLVPLVVQNAKQVVVRDLSIDWVRPAFTEAEVTAHVPGGFEFKTAPGADTFTVNAGRLTAQGGGDWPSGHLYNVLAFDRARREPLAGSHESWQIERTHRATDLGGGRFRLEADFSALPPVGGPVVFMHGDRVAPAVVLDQADDTELHDITIHHALGMGVIAQACRNLLWQRVRVVPSRDRLFSTWVDAVHAVDCGGSLRVLDCEFRGMFDDGANLHGAHRRVAGWPAPDRVVVEAMHHQQVGVVYQRPGDTVRFADLSTLDTVADAVVASVRVINSRLQELHLDRPLPALAGRPL